jgi:hypothetical protein
LVCYVQRKLSVSLCVFIAPLQWGGPARVLDEFVQVADIPLGLEPTLDERLAGRTPVLLFSVAYT